MATGRKYGRKSQGIVSVYAWKNPPRPKSEKEKNAGYNFSHLKKAWEIFEELRLKFNVAGRMSDREEIRKLPDGCWDFFPDGAFAYGSGDFPNIFERGVSGPDVDVPF